MQFTVTEVPERERFEARDEAGTVAGVVTYQLTGNIIVSTRRYWRVAPPARRGAGHPLVRAGASVGVD
jgi:hypothetical protein